MISASVELFVFNFCFDDFACKVPSPKYMQPPVWLRIFTCTAYAASTHVIKSSNLSAPIILLSLIVLLMNCINLFSFPQSSTVEQDTLVLKKSIVGSISGRVHFIMYSNFTTTEWKNSAFTDDNNFASSRTLNRYDFDGVTVLSVITSPKESIASCSWSIVSSSTVFFSVISKLIPRKVCFFPRVVFRSPIFFEVFD